RSCFARRGCSTADLDGRSLSLGVQLQGGLTSFAADPGTGKRTALKIAASWQRKFTGPGALSSFLGAAQQKEARIMSASSRTEEEKCPPMSEYGADQTGHIQPGERAGRRRPPISKGSYLRG